MKTPLTLIALGLGLAAFAAQAEAGPAPVQTADASQQERIALNNQQAAFAQHQLAQDAANQRAYEMAVATRKAEIHRQHAAYEAALRRHADEVQAYNIATRQWQQDVAACKSGDASKCANRPQAVGAQHSSR